MIKIKFSLTIAFILVSFLGNAQETTSSIDGMRKNAISFNIFGTTPIIGITYERVVSENVSLEIGAGIPSIGAGMKYFPWGIKESKMLFNVGLTGTYLFIASSEAFKTGEQLKNSDDKGYFIGYLPIGFSYFGEEGFNLGVDAGPAVGVEFGVYGSFKVGYRF